MLGAGRSPSRVITCGEAAGQECVRESLAASGFAVATASSAGDVLDLARSQSVDLVVLDADLPPTGGVGACWQIRAISPRTGIVMIAGSGETREKIRCLEAGADDCITTPIRPRELIARLKSVARRAGLADADRPRRIEAAGFRLDLERRSVWGDGKEISLSSKEFKLLAVLIQRAGVAVGRNELLRAAWGHHSDRPHLRTYVGKLRRKLGEQNILTDPGFGYRFAVSRTETGRQTSSGALRCELPPHEHGKLSLLRINQVRQALRENAISFPSPVPTFERHDRPDLQWRLVLLYFVRGWDPQQIAARHAMKEQRVRQILKSWTRRAIEKGLVQYIPPAEVWPNVAFPNPAPRDAALTGQIPSPRLSRAAMGAAGV